MKAEHGIIEQLMNEVAELYKHIRPLSGAIIPHHRKHLGSFRDISSQKESEKALKTIEEEFRACFENAKDAIFWADPQSDLIINCNKAAEILLEKKKDMVIGQHQTTLHPPEKSGHYSHMFKSHIDKQGVLKLVTDEAEVITSSGRIVPVLITASMILVEGRLVLQGVFCDISEQKKAREKIMLANERLHYLLSSSTAIIYACKTSGDYGATFISRNVAHITGYDADDFINDSSFWLSHIHPEDKDTMLNKLPLLFEKGSYTYEYRFRRKDGSYIWMRDEMKLIRDYKGDPLEIIGYWIDITDKKKTEEKLELLNRKLIKSNRKLNKLVLKDLQTGLYNHRYFEEIIESEFYRAKRYASHLSIIMIDLDYFKSINDAYGHSFGDFILKQFAKKLRKLVRLHDYVVRFGNEEFIVILPGSDRQGAMCIAKRILESIRTTKFNAEKNEVKLRLSGAVISYPEDNIIGTMDFIEKAEKVLDTVKDNGGDNICSSIDLEGDRSGSEIEKETIENFEYLKQKLSKLTRRSNQSLVESIFAFARTIELKDRFTGDHVEKTVKYATETAKRAGLSNQDVILIEQASMLHDLGKIGISEKILLKKGKLTKTEFEKIKEHPRIGVEIIRPIQFLHGLIPLILYHHERWDGTGYPCGLKADEIPIGARIIAIADVYQALISDRPYRKALSQKEAAQIIKENSGMQFDPAVTDIFLKIIQK